MKLAGGDTKGKEKSGEVVSFLATEFFINYCMDLGV